MHLYSPPKFLDKYFCICNYLYMYKIRFAKDVVKDLNKLSAFYQNQILSGIEKHLSYEPMSLSKNRKMLVNLIPPWDAEPPIWELRIGAHRIFYDVSEKEKMVFVRAIRKKPRDKTTKEIL